MTDLRDQLADFEAAARRLRHVVRPAPIRLTAGTNLRPLLRQLRIEQGLTLEALGKRTHVTRKAVSNRELSGVALPATALIEHLDALGYDLVAVPRTHAHRSAA